MSTFRDELDVATEDRDDDNESFSGRFHCPTPGEIQFPCCFYSGIAILIVMPLTGLIFFAVGLGRLNSAKSNFPNLQFASPPATVIAFHWLFVVSFSGIGGILLSVPFTPEPHKKHCIGLVVTGIITLVFYILYLTFYFKSAEYSASTNSWTAATYDMATQQMIKAQPYARFEGWVEDYYYRCTLNGYRNVYAVNATDSSIIPAVTQDVETNGLIWVKIELVINWGPGQKNVLTIWENTIINCFRVATVSEGVSYTEMVDGYVTGAFVSKDGVLPGSLGSGAATASGIFWAGIMHCYIVDAVPMLNVKVVKNGALVGETPSCALWPGVTCRTKSRTSSRY